MLNITDDLKTLDKLVGEAKPEEILETLRHYANLLWQNRGNLSGWNSVSADIAEKVWPLQEQLELLHVVLFNTKYENKIQGIYKSVTKEELDLRYAMFYGQLFDLVYRAAHMIYGQNQAVGNGRVLDFSDYVAGLVSLKYLLACGPKDPVAYHKYDGAVAQFMENTRTPPKSDTKPSTLQT